MQDFDEYLGLPEDPELAFVNFEHNLRDEMWNALGENTSSSYDHDRKVHYVTKVMAFHDAHEFNFLTRPDLIRGRADFDRTFDHFTDEVNYWTTQIQIRHAKRLRGVSTVIELTPEIRTQLHSYIGKIREVVSPLDLAIKKKEAILTKLNALAEEIDRDRTKTEAWTSFALEIASTTGEAAKQLNPVQELVDKIGNALGKAKKMAEDALGLPSPAPRKQIEGPRKQLPKPEDSMDDEIPF